ncbi:MAG: hypothetical protein ACKOAD_07255 [Gammaproteobacteria bacterium]
MIISLEHFQQEWHLTYWNCNQSELDWQTGPKQNLWVKTFIFEAQTETIYLKPILPNRSLYSKLGKILYIPAYEQINLFVVSSIWIEMGISRLNLKLDTIPSRKLLDTWLGNNTWTGELCYAGHTQCSSDLTKLEYQSDCMITPLYIQNKSRHILSLDRVTLPLPYLCLYQDSNNRLWTEQVTVVREGHENPNVTIKKGQPPGIPDLKLITEAKESLMPGNSLKTVFNILVGK